MRETKPRVLIVYFTYTQQNHKVAEAMADAFEDRGCDVTQAQVSRAFANGLADSLWPTVTSSH